VFVGVADVEVDVAVVFSKLVPFSAVEVVAAFEPTKIDLVDFVEPDCVPVALEVTVVVSESRVS
jgi:hypothetical protein